MIHLSEERFLSGVLADRVSQLGHDYENCFSAPDECFLEAYGAMVETLVSMVPLLPPYAQSEVMGERPASFPDENGPDVPLIALFRGLQHMRQIATIPRANTKDWRRALERAYEEPLSEALAWCPAYVPATRRPDDRVVPVYEDGDVLCAALGRCYCGNWSSCTVF